MKNISMVSTFLIVISFFVIVVFPSYDQYHFNKTFYRILQKGFPDWEGRIEYEKKQRDLYQSEQNKLKMSPLGISSSKESLEKVFSSEERDAIAYYQGTGVYQYYQKIEKRPNIFDTQETFLLKMHDKDAREKFLNALNILELQSDLSEKNLE